MAFVQATTGFNSSGSNSTLATSAFGGTTVAGNAIIVGICINSATATVATIADTQGNAYRQLATIAGNNMSVFLYVATHIISGASNIVTVTEGVGTDGQILAQEWSGFSDSILDNSRTDSGSSANPTTSGVLTGATSNPIIFSVLMLQSQTNVWSLGSGYTNLSSIASNFSSGGMESKAGGDPGATYTASFGMTNTGTLYLQVTAALRVSVGLPQNYQFLKVGSGISVTEKIR